ncbi:nucleotidyltransferase family protein [Dongia deserti]|uniref:nucleotidyltransferase family protein n=1 Tax=Dongia deserti TaxID=2268030 RepID=UPI000E65543C|nr:nucleotidyltransferase family protein [Dongia deserti]
MSGPRTSQPSNLQGVARQSDGIRLIAKCLSFRDTVNLLESLRALLSDAAADWLTVVRLANHHLVTPALWSAIDRRGFTALLPNDLDAYLRLLYETNRKRNRLIRDEALAALQELNRHCIQPVVMKSALTLFDPSCDEGASIMADVDLLIRRQELPVAISALRSIGYDLLAVPPAHAHAWTFYRPLSLATIDLHCDVGPQRALLSADAVRSVAKPVARNDLAMDAPSINHRVLMLVMNFGVFERHYFRGHIPLRGLRDLGEICQRNGSDIDWDYLCHSMSEPTLSAQAAAMFHMARELMNIPIPIFIRRTAAADRHLRRCFLQLAHPSLDRVARAYAAVAWPFNRARMDYRHHCGTHGRSLAVARLRHALDILSRRSPLRSWRAASLGSGQDKVSTL